MRREISPPRDTPFEAWHSVKLPQRASRRRFLRRAARLLVVGAGLQASRGGAHGRRYAAASARKATVTDTATLMERALAVCPDIVAEARAQAEASLTRGPFSVMDKTAAPPSGDRHDFSTLSPYFWPDPDTADGLPYVFRDGELNPEASSDKYDRVRFFAMGDTVKASALGYRLTDDERFAAHAARLLRTWFLDPATQMNPNLNHAQQVPGKSAGNPTGIIRGMLILDLVERANWLDPSPHWTAADRDAWHEWLGAYLEWLGTSDLGQRESRAFNNHATWYDVQRAKFAVACGREEVAVAVLREVGPRRIAKQIQPDGRQPKAVLMISSYLPELLGICDRIAVMCRGELGDSCRV